MLLQEFKLQMRIWGDPNQNIYVFITNNLIIF